MGFKAAKKTILTKLLAGSYMFEARNDVDDKNLFATAEVDLDFVMALIKKASNGDLR